MTKKRKQEDFKKVKLKVGKKIKKATDTDTTVKSKKIVIQEAKHPRSLAAIKHGGISLPAVLKLSNLSKIYETGMLKDAENITSDVINIIGKMYFDFDYRSRDLAAKCLLLVLETQRLAQISLEPTISLLLTHVKCGLTHLNPDIVKTARTALKLLLRWAPLSMQQVFLPVLDAQTNSTFPVSQDDLELVLNYFEKFNANQEQNGQNVPVVDWSTSTGRFPWSTIFKPIISNGYDCTFRSVTSVDSNEQFKTKIQAIVDRKLKEWLRIGNSHAGLDDRWNMKIEDAKRFILLLKLHKELNMKWDDSSDALPMVEVTSQGKKSKIGIASTLTKDINLLLSRR